MYWLVRRRRGRRGGGGGLVPGRHRQRHDLHGGAARSPTSRPTPRCPPAGAGRVAASGGRPPPGPLAPAGLGRRGGLRHHLLHPHRHRPSSGGSTACAASRGASCCWRRRWRSGSAPCGRLYGAGLVGLAFLTDNSWLVGEAGRAGRGCALPTLAGRGRLARATTNVGQRLWGPSRSPGGLLAGAGAGGRVPRRAGSGRWPGSGRGRPNAGHAAHAGPPRIAYLCTRRSTSSRPGAAVARPGRPAAGCSGRGLLHPGREPRASAWPWPLRRWGPPGPAGERRPLGQRLATPSSTTARHRAGDRRRGAGGRWRRPAWRQHRRQRRGDGAAGPGPGPGRDGRGRPRGGLAPFLGHRVLRAPPVAGRAGPRRSPGRGARASAGGRACSSWPPRPSRRAGPRSPCPAAVTLVGDARRRRTTPCATGSRSLRPGSAAWERAWRRAARAAVVVCTERGRRSRPAPASPWPWRRADRPPVPDARPVERLVGRRDHLVRLAGHRGGGRRVPRQAGCAGSRRAAGGEAGARCASAAGGTTPRVPAPGAASAGVTGRWSAAATWPTGRSPRRGAPDPGALLRRAALPRRRRPADGRHLVLRRSTELRVQRLSARTEGRALLASSRRSSTTKRPPWAGPGSHQPAPSKWRLLSGRRWGGWLKVPQMGTGPDVAPGSRRRTKRAGCWRSSTAALDGDTVEADEGRARVGARRPGLGDRASGTPFASSSRPSAASRRTAGADVDEGPAWPARQAASQPGVADGAGRSRAAPAVPVPAGGASTAGRGAPAPDARPPAAASTRSRSAAAVMSLGPAPASPARATAPPRRTTPKKRRARAGGDAHQRTRRRPAAPGDPPGCPATDDEWARVPPPASDR